MNKPSRSLNLVINVAMTNNKEFKSNNVTNKVDDIRIDKTTNPVRIAEKPFISNDNNMTEKHSDKVNANKNNKLTHTINGNVKLDKIRVLQINKGLADVEVRQDLIRFNIKNNEGDLIFVSETNNQHEQVSKRVSIKKCFKGF